MKIITEQAAARLHVLTMQWRSAPESLPRGFYLPATFHGPVRPLQPCMKPCKPMVAQAIAQFKRANNIAGLSLIRKGSPQWSKFANSQRGIAKQVLPFLDSQRVYG